MKSWLKFYGPFIAAAIFVLAWIALFNYISPAAIVEKVGAKNAYLVSFLLAVICGFSSFTGTAFYAAIATFSHGGVHPLLLGLVGGIGLCISDFAFFYVVSKGTHVIDKHWEKFSRFIRNLAHSAPDWLLYVFVFIYSGFFPIPNDILIVALALGGIRFRKIAAYLFAGDIVSTLLLAYIAH
jgi:hypothetical protein